MKPMHRWLIISWALLWMAIAFGGELAHATPHSEGATAAGIPITTTVTVLPTIRMVDAPIQVTVAGTWSDGCVPYYVAHQVSEATVTITTATPPPEIVCGQGYGPWSITVALGHLPAADYQLQVQGALTLSTTLRVFDHFHYLPLMMGQ